jgi:hypothetical protein
VGQTLDFLVIGAQRSGTTSLWRHLGSHPQVHVPPSKEAPFFCDDRLLARGLSWYLGEYFATAEPERLWGTVSPHYMMGSPDTDVAEIARRIRASVPDVKLIAILRDPLARAQSHHRMVVHRGRETRSFDRAVLELLEPDALERARREPPNVQPYLVQGEYGRILAAYLDLFPREQLHVLLTSDLEGASAQALRTIFAFLEIDELHEVAGLEEHHHRGGRARRLDPAAEQELKDYLAREVWPRTPRAPEQQRAFNFWFAQWNVIPEAQLPPIDTHVRQLLEEHYARDAELLEAITGLRAPWRGSADSPSTCLTPAAPAPSASPPPARMA